MEKRQKSLQNRFHFINNDYTSQAFFFLSFTTATILGNYTRVGLSKLSNYGTSYVAPGSILWSNLVACILMGMLQVLKKGGWFELEQISEMFVVLTTGYCGALSSYSSMILEMFLHSANLTPINVSNDIKLPNRAYGIMEFLSVLLVQLFVSVGSYIFGRSFAKTFILPLGYRMDMPEMMSELQREPPVPQLKIAWTYKTVRAVQWIFALLAIPLIALIIVLTCVYSNYSRSSWTLAQLFAIPAGFLRFFLAKLFNSKLKRFPLGTFIANVSAVATLAVFTMCLRGRSHSGSSTPIAGTVTQCQALSALSSGFSATLSTVSTFINEGYNLPLFDALVYYAVSISASYCVMVVMLGSLAWTRGLTSAAC
ncbi:hypothetical protein HG535_0C02010 [Zygotorulaspora mrakii]|uniref:Uncharacterized protein n=1 Tax=Zygotorulaspora mrakii TaxID=42260 RepID=A0A7H9B256_ZYGMR|nr:uncharacterized protein HG535_0C02010 [Zygotorulaspora mrakii]QLG71852.1 hypothetical protein HG535_0C02010 [Zygotorulaspora mrakii]